MDAGARGRPRFKSSVRPVVDPDGGLFVLSEREPHWLRGQVYADLAPLLDGNHEVDEIFARLVDAHPAPEILGALDRLRAAGCLAENAGGGSGPAAAFWELLGVPPAAAWARLDAVRVTPVSFGSTDARELGRLLEAQGVAVAPEGDLAVVLTDDYLRPELETFNRRSLASGTPWLLVKPVGVATWLGPAFVPSRTACWQCLSHRLRGHRRLEGWLESRLRLPAPPLPCPAGLPSTAAAAVAEAATEVSRWVATGGRTPLEDRVLSTDLETLHRTWHTLVRRPQCPACGHSPPRTDARNVPPLRLSARAKARASSDHGQRACDPNALHALLEKHLSPITGIVSHLAPGERSGPGPDGRWHTPTFSADHNFSDMHDDRFFLREGMRRRSGGKGRSPAQARASALAESLERYSGVFDGTEPRLRATFESLGSAAVHPNACMCYSARQYEGRGGQDHRTHKARWVPEPFREDAEIEWTPLWSLTRDEPRWLPTSYCYFGYRSADPLFARADSNGCAAGCVLEEAVLQGFLELVERDAVALWWYNRLRRPGVDLDAVDDPYVAELCEHYHGLGRELWVLDVTSDLAVPTFAALSRRSDAEAEDVIYGFGAHLDAGVALMRALTEVNQSLEAVPLAAASGDGADYQGDHEAVRWWREVTVAEAPWLAPDPAKELRRLADFEVLASHDVREDVRTCVALAARHGIETLVLDQTRPDVGLPVVRVVAPGLRHFWARFGPGRLYEVPVREGWLSRPLEERELNPFVIHF